MRQVALFGAMTGLPRAWIFRGEWQEQDNAQSRAEQAGDTFVKSPEGNEGGALGRRGSGRAIQTLWTRNGKGVS
jgi:hypothetical protein